MRATLITIATLTALVLSPAPGRAADPLQGPVILARSGAHPIYIWDASTYVARLVTDKNVGVDGLRALEATSLLALSERAKASHANELTIQTIYSRTGAVSPTYAAATFGGVERVCTLTASRAALVRSGDKLAHSLQSGMIPPEVRVGLTGKLPDVQ